VYIYKLFSHVFKKHFSYFFNAKEKKFNTITYHHFSKISFMQDNEKNICKLSSAVKNKIYYTNG